MIHIFLVLFCLTSLFTCYATEPLEEATRNVPNNQIIYNIDLTADSAGEYLFFEVYPTKKKNKVGFSKYEIAYSGETWVKVFSFLDADIGYDISWDNRATQPSKLLLINLSPQELKYKFYEHKNSVVINIQEFTPLSFSEQPIEIQNIKGSNAIKEDLTLQLLSKLPNPFKRMNVKKGME